MATQKKNPEITPADLKTLQKQLKRLDTGWVQLLVDKIKAQHTTGDYALVNEQKIYNVFNRRLKNGGWKLTIYKNGKDLVKALQKPIIAVKK